VHERPPAEGDVRRVAVGPVLVFGVLNGLVRHRVLQLGRGDGDAVDEEAQIDRLRGGRVERELARDGQAVGFVELGQFGREAVGRLEEREPDLDAVIVDAVAQNVHRATLVELLRQAIGELLAGTVCAAVNGNEALPRLRCVSARNANSSAVSSPRTRSKSPPTRAWSPLVRGIRLLNEARVIASSKPLSSGFIPRALVWRRLFVNRRQFGRRRNRLPAAT